MIEWIIVLTGLALYLIALVIDWRIKLARDKS